MPGVTACIKTSDDERMVDDQKHAVMDFARKNNLIINEFVEMPHRKKDRETLDIVARLQGSSTLIISELGSLGRSASEVVDNVNSLIRNNVRLIIAGQDIDLRPLATDIPTRVIIKMFTIFAGLERSIIEEKAKMALKTMKDRGVRPGKPKGSIGRSKLDGKEEYIKELYGKKVGLATIARIIGTSRTNLEHYIRTRTIVLPRREPVKKRVSGTE